VLEELELLHPLRAVDRHEEHAAPHAFGARVECDGGPDDRVPVRPQGVIGEPLGVGKTLERRAQHVAEADRAISRWPPRGHLKKILDSTRCGGI